MGIGRTPEERFYQEIQKLQDRINQLESRPLQIPYLNADPSTDFKGNIWMFQDGRVHIRLADGTIKELVTSASSGGTSGTPNPAVPAQPITTSKTWPATWSQAYRQSGGFTGSNQTYLYYGNSGDSAFNGTQHSLVGFDYADIQTFLAGSTINKVEIFLDSLHTWANSGSTCFFGMHTNATKPSTYGGVYKDLVSSAKLLRNEQAYHTLSTEFGQALRDGSAKGIILQAPNSSTSYYGYVAGVGSGLPVPVLRVTYTK